MNRRIHPVVLVLSVAATAACGNTEQVQRQADVAAAGAEVMPFDLDATTHIFEKLEDGGLQTVIADSEDPEQISRIREHLSEEAERFARGDFHDPAKIHGEDMPGLHMLVMGHDRLRVHYEDVVRGAAIRYSSDDPAIVQALHEWFDAQLSDHGEHAQAPN